MEKTIENLKKAFTGESLARNRYTNFAKLAKE
ncbi:ferritin family protein [Methanohalobium evestigatum]